jgi:type IV secretion system protein VirB6
VLAHLDCQAQVIGSYGFQALAQPGSPASVALTGLLTLFVALFACRLLFAGNVGPRDVVNAVLKVGIVLTLAASWPAFRTLAYDTVLKGPAEVAATITPSTLAPPDAGFAERLQNVDSGMAALTLAGSGRQTGALVELEGTTGQFRSIALEDESGYGWARTIYLASAIGSLAILRVAGGLLLALTPLFAGLLLFDLSRGLFAGWLRGLVLVALGSLGITLLLSVELAVLEPWLADALSRRSLGYATPTAPTELLALALAFAIAVAGLFALLTRVAFQNSWLTAPLLAPSDTAAPSAHPIEQRPVDNVIAIPVHSRALAVSESVATVMRREMLEYDGAPRRISYQPGAGREPGTARSTGSEPLGSGYRRSMTRGSSSRTRRDGSS